MGMRCLLCKSKTKVLSTRTQDEFCVVRRLRCLADKEHIFSTLELPAVMPTKGGGLRQIETKRKEAAQRTIHREDIRKKIQKMVVEGHKLSVISSQFKVSLSTVNREAKRARLSGLTTIRHTNRLSESKRKALIESLSDCTNLSKLARELSISRSSVNRYWNRLKTAKETSCT